MAQNYGIQLLFQMNYQNQIQNLLNQMTFVTDYDEDQLTQMRQLCRQRPQYRRVLNQIKRQLQTIDIRRNVQGIARTMHHQEVFLGMEQPKRQSIFKSIKKFLFGFETSSVQFPQSSGHIRSYKKMNIKTREQQQQYSEYEELLGQPSMKRQKQNIARQINGKIDSNLKQYSKVMKNNLCKKNE